MNSTLRRYVCCQEKINKCQKAVYFRAFCEAAIIRKALRKVRFSYMEIYPLSEFAGPLIVSIDPEGRNLFEENKVIFSQRKAKAIEKICKYVGFIK